jgi:hypothetical protein
MRKLVAGLLTAGLLAIPASASADQTGVAPGIDPHIITGLPCYASADIAGGTQLSTTDSRIVITTNSQSISNTMLTCHFDAPAISKTIDVSGFPCFLVGFGGLATDTHFVYTPGGSATLSCQIKRWTNL